MAAGNGQKSLLELLANNQIVSADQLERVSAYQKSQNVSLEHALVELHILEPDELITLYRDLLQIHFLKLEDVEIDDEALRHVPGTVAHRHHLIPVRRSGNSLAVAMTDPTNAQSLAALKSVTDFDIIPFIARYDAIEHALCVHYGDPVLNSEEAGASNSGDQVTRARALVEDERGGSVGKSAQLNRNQIFESFVCDAANEFPLRIARSIADPRSEDLYNPFHCWGPEGCGKSHLLFAIANLVAAQSPLKRVLLTTGQRFVDELFRCIRDKKVNFFRYLYGELDLLLMDDAEVVLTRDWAQRELLETLRTLERKGRRLAIAARTNLALEPRTMPELRVALESGVIAGFSQYSFAGKLEIVRRQSAGVDLPEPVLAEIVRSAADTIGDLLDLLQQVTVMATLEQKDVTVDAVRDLVQLCCTARGESAGQRARTLGSKDAVGYSGNAQTQ